MVLKCFILLCSLIHAIHCGTDDQCHNVHHVDVMTVRLIDNLERCMIKRNDPYPDNPNDPVNVTFDVLDVKLLGQNDKSNMKYFEFTIRYRWRNEYFSWPNSRDHPQSIYMHGFYMWTPRFKLRYANNREMSYGGASMVQMSYNGSLEVYKTYEFPMKCENTYSTFPNDKHTCLFPMTFERTTVSSINYNLGSFSALPSRAKEWKMRLSQIVGSNIFMDPKNPPDIQVWNMIIHVDRIPNLHNSLITIPSFILSFFILISFWVPAKNNQRFALTIFLFLAVLTQIRAVQRSLPTGLIDTPMIVKYLLVLMVLLHVSIATSVITSLLRKQNGCQGMPGFIKTIFSNHVVQRLLFVSQHSKSLIHSSKSDDVIKDRKLNKLLMALDEWVSKKTYESGHGDKSVNSDFKIVALSVERIVFAFATIAITISTIVTAANIL